MAATTIHPTACVHPTAELADGVVVGAFAVIGARVTLGEGTEVGGHAHVLGPSRFGRENRIYPHACLGFDPQDLKFRGEESWLLVGDRNQFREFCTLNRGTESGGGRTVIGNDNLFMTQAHVGHDCRVGSRIVFANAATLAGHVEIQDDATVSATCGVHQHCRVGRHGYVGGYSVIVQDVLPFSLTVGHKPKCYGINRIGLERKGFEAAQIARLQKAFKVILRSGLNTAQALAALRRDGEAAEDPEVRFLIEFIEASERGVIKAGRRGARGAAPD